MSMTSLSAKTSYKVERARMLKTRDMATIEQITTFMKIHLYELYDQLEEVEEFSSEWDYVSGSIDTTHVYLLKCGVEYLEHTDYIEKVNDPNWKRD
jgi:hypothetical protein